jgi:arginase
MRIEIVTVPYRYDEFNQGLGAGPQALVTAGVASRIAAAGHEVANPVAASLDSSKKESGQTAVNIGRLGASTALLVAEARNRNSAVVCLTGDDTAAIGVVAGLQQAHGASVKIGLVWIDAHGDFNTPQTSFSGILAGMPVAVLAGLAGPRWRDAAGQLAVVPTDRILIAGVRDLDNQEESLLRATAATVLDGDKARALAPFADAVNELALRCDLLYLHLDLDVLDPELVPSASTPAPLGLDIKTVSAMMSAAYDTGAVAATSFSSLNPGGGRLGQRSISTTLALIERATAAWSATPTLDAARA